MSKLAEVYIKSQKENYASARFSLAAMCHAFATMAPMPITRQESPELAYHSLVRHQMNALLNEINEQCPIRISEAQHLIQTLWEIRYRAIYPIPSRACIGLLLTKEQLPEIYLNELKDAFDEDSGWVEITNRYLEAAYEDQRGGGYGM